MPELIEQDREIKVREKRVLILAYYFPPLGMGGVQRVLKFVKHLPSFGWKPYVLTVKDVEYWAKDFSLLEELPPEAEVVRTGSFDPLRISFILKSIFKKRTKQDKATRENAVRRIKISSWIFFPDNKVGWIPFALLRGLFLLRKEKPDLIFSSSPPPSLHLVGYLLKLITDIPWIADFRDPWMGYKLETFPTPLHLFLKKKMEKLIIENADMVIAANSAIKGEFESRHPHAKNLFLIDQGYDEGDFGMDRACSSETFTIGYLGTFSPDCDPEPFFAALEEFLVERAIPKEKVKFVHVGFSVGIDLKRLIEEYRLQQVVQRKGYLPHRKALDQMKDVSLLLLLTSDHPLVFPAKTFEYLRLKKPILGMVNPKSEIARFLKEMKVGKVVSPEDRQGIKETLLSCFSDLQERRPALSPNEEDLKRFDRRILTLRLTSLFDRTLKG